MTEPTQAPGPTFLPEGAAAAARDQGPVSQFLPQYQSSDPAPEQPKVTLDLDALDAEQPRDVREPFTLRLKGELFLFEDPEELDWQDLSVGEQNPRLMLHLILGNDEQRERFFGLKDVKVRHMRRITEDYAKHYGLGVPGEGAGSARS